MSDSIQSYSAASTGEISIDVPRTDSSIADASDSAHATTLNEREHAVSARDAALARIFSKIVWDEVDLSVFFNVTVDTIRHMKSRGEIPAVVHLNLRCWRVHRDAFFEHLKQRGMPKNERGRPPRAGKSLP